MANDLIDRDQYIDPESEANNEVPISPEKLDKFIDDVIATLNQDVTRISGDVSQSGNLNFDGNDINNVRGIVLVDGNENIVSRIIYNPGDNRIIFQENTGDNDNPSWTDRFEFGISSSGQLFLADNTGIVFPDGSQIHSDDFNSNGRVTDSKNAQNADSVGTEVANGTSQLSDGSTIISTGETDTSNTYFLALGVEDPDSDVKISGKVFWDDSAGEHKIEIVEVGTDVGNPTAVYKVFKV